MEVFAGFVEHTDAQVGKADRRARPARPPRQHASSSTSGATTARAPRVRTAASANCWPRTTSPTPIEQQIAALNKIGGLDALGGPKIDNMYHAGWAWAGDTPFQSHQAGRLALRRHAQPDGHLVAEAASSRTRRRGRSSTTSTTSSPTIYEMIGIKPPKVVNGFKQDPIDGVSMAYTFADAEAPGRKKIQYFENNGSRGIYHDGWFACTFGPFVPWDTASTAGARRLGREQGRVGALRPDEGLLAGRRPRREGARTTGADEGTVPGRGEGEQGVPHRRRALDSLPSRGPSSRRPTRVAVRRDDDPDAGVHRAGPRQARATTSRSTSRSARTPPACSTPSAARRGGPDALHGQGAARLRVQHADHRAVPGAQRSEVAPGKHRIEVDDDDRSSAGCRPPRWSSRWTARRSPARR